MQFIKKIFLYAILLLNMDISLAQNSDSTEFKSYGNPIIKVFANYHNSINGDEDFTGFEIRRAYLGYEYNINEHFYAVVKIDIGSPDDVSPYSRIRRYAYFKNAALGYTWKNLRVDFGLIDMQHFILQEKFWGYRYIARSYSDRYRFGPKADLGIDIIYNVKDIITLDLTLSNGEGYTNLQRHNTIKFGAGFILTPFKGLFVRGYFDAMEKDNLESTLASFIGYRFRKLFRVACEYNYKFNQDFIENHDRYGISTYATINLHEKIEVFGRYDWLTSNIIEDDDVPWNLPYDGSSILTGIQYAPVKRVKLSLNYQDWVPYAKNEENLSFIYLNVEFKY